MQVPTDKQDLFDKIDDMDEKLEQVQIVLKRWERVEDMCKDHFHKIEVEGQLIDHLDDDMHYIFEAAMEATFGKGIWPKYNRLNSENSKREHEKFRRQTLNNR